MEQDLDLAELYIPSAYVMTYRDWGNGLLTKKELFRNISTGTSPDTYQKVSDERMNYTAFYTKTLSGFYAFQIANYPDNSGSSIGDAFGAREFIDRDVFSGQCYNKVDFLMPASINPQNISTGGYYLKSDTVSQYESASTITTVTEYEHANQFHNYPTKITKTLSTGEKK